MHHFVPPEEISCIGEVNADPDLLNHEEHTHAPDYSEPIVPECLDDSNMASDIVDTTMNIYNTLILMILLCRMQNIMNCTVRFLRLVYIVSFSME